MENMKAFAIVEDKDKLPLSWNKGAQAVLPPTEFYSKLPQSGRMGEEVKRSFYIFLCPRRDSSAWASRISWKSTLVDNFKNVAIIVISSTHF